jgi:hypothetical protein
MYLKTYIAAVGDLRGRQAKGAYFYLDHPHLAHNHVATLSPVCSSQAVAAQALVVMDFQPLQLYSIQMTALECSLVVARWELVYLPVVPVLHLLIYGSGGVAQVVVAPYLWLAVKDEVLELVKIGLWVGTQQTAELARSYLLTTELDSSSVQTAVFDLRLQLVNHEIAAIQPRDFVGFEIEGLGEPGSGYAFDTGLIGDAGIQTVVDSRATLDFGWNFAAQAKVVAG